MAVVRRSRKSVVDAVNLAGRELSASSVMFHSVMAEKFGLTVTDWRAWDLVLRHGPLTAGNFAQLTGLTPGAVTGLIDRLVEAGAVERVRDSQDRRKVLVKATLRSSDQQVANSLFAPMLQAVERLYADYTDDQLRMIAGFMTRMAVLLREQTARSQYRGGSPLKSGDDARVKRHT
jgi:DNA-binding MarR family transcriptional regulator